MLEAAHRAGGASSFATLRARAVARHALGQPVDVGALEQAHPVRLVSTEEFKSRQKGQASDCVVQLQSRVAEQLVLTAGAKNETNPPPLRVAVAMLYDDAYASMAAMWQQRARLYAKRHGYVLEVHQGSLDAQRPIAWSKVRWLQHLLEEQQYDWLVSGSKGATQHSLHAGLQGGCVWRSCGSTPTCWLPTSTCPCQGGLPPLAMNERSVR